MNLSIGGGCLKKQTSHMSKTDLLILSLKSDTVFEGIIPYNKKG